MLREIIEYLDVKSGKKYIDCTLGGGGHSAAIINKGGIVLSLDQDEEAIRYVAQKFEIRNSKLETKSENSKYKIIKIKDNWSVVKGNFANVEEIAKEAGFEKVAGVLFDLGVSSHQLEDEKRGFSFNSDEELDMRMDKSLGVKASVLVNGLTRKELERIFLELGEEKNAWKIAKEIEKVRKVLPIRTCRQLSEICRKVVGFSGKLNPATKVFQALRIQVNDELGSLTKGLESAFNLLDSKGRIVVISFHSLEDRIVKNYFKKLSEKKLAAILTDKPKEASEEEVKINNRARSAKLRAVEKI